MRREIVIVLLGGVLVAVSMAQRRDVSRDAQEYKSPDSAVVAYVSSTQAHEGRIELLTQSGKVLASVGYSSTDGEHGYEIEKASWTPDSEFFVYSLGSTGGHQAWHSPVDYFSRKRNKIFSLDDALRDAVTNPQFTITSPDKITVKLISGKKEMTVSLSGLHSRRRYQVPSWRTAGDPGKRYPQYIHNVGFR